VAQKIRNLIGIAGMLRIALFIGSISLSSIFPNLCAEALTAEEISKKVETNFTFRSTAGTLTQTISIAEGESRDFKIKFYTKDENAKILVKYIEPEEMKGLSFLIISQDSTNDIWMYSPQTDTVQHFESPMLMGSEFIYANIYKNMFEGYTPKLLGTGKIDKRNGYHLLLTPIEENSEYSKIELWIAEQTFVPLKIDFYEREEPSRRLLLSNIKNVNNHWTPTHIEILDLIDNTKTTVYITEIKFDTKLSDDIFSVNNLKKL
jgi:outer membrane lipoprotein-sorting protein